MENHSNDAKMIPISTRIPESLYKKLQRYMKKEYYSSVSEAVRGIIREFLKKESTHDDEIIDANNCDAEVLER